MRTIALVNQKGGCGKTTTAVNLASYIADTGRRVLLVDCDPQSHASIGLGIDTDELERSTYDLFMDPAAQVRDVVHPVTETLDVAPSNVILSAIGTEAVLTALAREKAKLGLVFLEMRRAADDLSQLID